MEMSRRWILGLGLAAMSFLPIAAHAHGGHLHKVMGTVATVDGNQLAVKATDGKMVTIVLDAKTTVTRGKAKLDPTALKTGERVSIDYMQEKNVNMAKAIKLGTASAVAK
jgi:hypothetical protein